MGSTYITFFLALAFCFFGGDGVWEEEEVFCDCDSCTGVVCGGTVVVSVVVIGIVPTKKVCDGDF